MFIEVLLLPLECDHSPEAAPAIDDRLEAAAGDDVMEAHIVISVYKVVYEVQSTIGAESEDVSEDERNF